MSVGKRSSSEIAGVWDSRLRPDRCKDTYLVDYLGDLGLLAYGYDPADPDDDLELRGRDRDRVRLVKRISTSPEGIYLPTLVSECVKGQYIGQCERFDGSDPDYQFVYRFLNDLDGHDPQLIEKRQSDGMTMVTPTIRLLDLISEGITQTTRERDDLLYDRHFCENYLRTANEVDDWGRDLLEDSLHRYLKRIENYQLLFDVHFCGRRGGDTTRRMTKQYNTRFNSQGRLRKTWARYNSALEHAYEEYDNAVLMTLTTDPGTFDDPTRPDPRSLYDGISSINPNFNRLLSYFDSDPSTKDDTRKDGVPSWTSALDGKVTGRPRYRPPYLKALEFTEKGYAHLHVLMFDVPTRESDGMPFLIDKAELERKWKDYGQGQIVDLYPLVFRDDLDDVGNFGTKTLVDDDGDQFEVPVSKGFVDWYRYGDHDHSEEWIAKNARSHDLIEFYDDESGEDSDEQMQSRTAGAYLGKYLSATFGSLLEASESFEDAKESDSYADKAATWKLGLYWATGRRFWSISRDIEKAIERPEHLQDPDVRHAVREFSIDSLHLACDGATVDDLDLDDVVTPGVESTLPESADFYCHIDYLGCYAYWDMPTADATAANLEHVEDYVASGGQPEYPDVGGEKPPPVADVWG
ncbi:putative Rep protein [Haloferax virus Halfgib1]|nr:putative Rep protein [Haloferax virus Halfgib1]